MNSRRHRKSDFPVRWGRLLRHVCTAGVLLSLIQPAWGAIVEFAQVSDPSGIVVQTSNLDTPVVVTTITAPAASGSYRFTHWTINGVRYDDDLGRSQNPAGFTLYEATAAIAHYLPAAQDTDTDGLPDWYEIEYYGNLTQTGTSDTDGDGYSLAQEYALGFHPRVYDELVAGGLSRVRSSSVAMNLDLSPTYRLVSSPPGFVSVSNIVVAGTVVATADLWGQANSGYRFAYWDLEGVRQQDNYGIALGGFSFTVTSNTVATAHYYPAAQDSDADGVADWFEYVYYPTLAQGGGSDTDGDGYTLAEELALGTLPTLPDEFVPGGLARARSATVTVNLADFPVYWLLSSPPGFVNSSNIVNLNTVVFTPDLWGQQNSGYRFAYWDLDGVRQQDAYGIALGGFSFTVTSNTVATAHYYASAQDSDADGVADWFVYVYFPTTTWSSRTNIQYLYDNSTTRSDPITGIQCGDEIWTGDEVNLVGTTRFMTGFSFELFANDTAGLTIDVELRLNDGPPFNGYQTPGTLVYGYYGFSLPNTAGSLLSFDAADLDGFDGQPDGGSFIPGNSALTLAVRYHYNGGGGVAGVTLYDPPVAGSSYADFWEQEGNQWKLKVSTNQTVNFGMRIGTTPEVIQDFDPDGDGLNLIEEFNLGTVPVLRDEFVPGGISRARAAAITVMDLQPFERLQYTLVDGVLSNFFRGFDGSGGAMLGPNAAPALGDWDGDGDLDLFVAYSPGGVRVFENIGSRYTMDLAERTLNFTNLAAAWTGIDMPALALGDWSGGGTADLAVGGTGGTVRLISSTGHFSATQSPAVNYALATGSASAIPALADLNGDARADLLVLLADGTVNLYLNTSNATLPFVDPPSAINLLGVAVPDASGLAVADINYDGRPDVLVSDLAGRVWEFHQASGGGFTLQSKVWAGSGAGFANRLTVAAADVDGDGDVDLIGGYHEGGLVSLRDPRFGIPVDLRAAGGTRSILLSWDPDRQSRLVGYYVYRSAGTTNSFALLTNAIVTTPRYEDQQPVASVTNFYHVTAVSAVIYPGNSLPLYVEGRPSDHAWAVAGGVTLWMPDYYGQPGSNTVLRINTPNATGISGTNLEIRVSYDPAIMTPAAQVGAAQATVAKTGLSEGLLVSDNGLTAGGVLIITGLGGGVLTGQGNLFDLNFRVVPGAALGTRTTNTLAQVTLYDGAGNPLPVDTTDSAVMTVANAYFPGDVNGDGIVSQADFVLAMKLAVGQRAATPDEIAAGDMNGNGTIDKDDAHLLLRLIHDKDPNPK